MRPPYGGRIDGGAIARAMPCVGPALGLGLAVGIEVGKDACCLSITRTIINLPTPTYLSATIYYSFSCCLLCVPPHGAGRGAWVCMMGMGMISLPATTHISLLLPAYLSLYLLLTYSMSLSFVSVSST
jgi:hypothetical protein